MGSRIHMIALPAVLAMYLPFCATEVRPTLYPADAAPVSLWQAPTDLPQRDTFYGPWGSDRAPIPDAVYTFVERKRTGVNPGMTVRDPEGQQWSVKQAPGDGRPDEGPVEVVLSRVLSAVGYHQPPIYYVSSFRLADDWGIHTERGGRFRLKEKRLKDLGEWSWQQNPFVGTTSYRGLLVILMMFNSSDLKNANNSLYEYRGGERPERWYVVRDIGTALGGTGRLAPRKNDPEAFERHGFIAGIHNGFVEFDYRGWHQELFQGRMTPADVRWASDLLAGLTDAQWDDAFRAGDYSRGVAARFIGVLRAKVAAGQQIGATDSIALEKGD